VVTRGLICALALLATLPACASAHARLEGTSPARGAVLERQPGQVVLSFSETVEGAFGAVRVFDARAERVDAGRVNHPGGAGAKLAVGLNPGLPDGTYTATYRVLSADGHPVSGGLVFSIGKPGAGPSKTIDELIGASRAGALTRATSRIAAALQYLATALAAGFVIFALACWRGALQAPRARRFMLGAVALGLVASVVGIVAEGANAGATSVWAALDAGVVGDVLGTRFGRVWGLRIVVWVALGAAVLARRGPAWLAPAAAALVFAPALEGHSTTISPTALLVPIDALHVLAMTAWLGGLAALLFVLPSATRTLEPVARTRLLAAVLARFSPIALAAVATLAVTGTIAAISLLTAVSQLWDTGYGRELLAKIALLGGLIALGAVNRRRLLPRLRRLAADGGAPGAAGRALRATLRTEVALLAAVLAVSSVLVDGIPPVSAAPGPFSASKRLGPLDLELALDPARAGPNELHLYLFDAKDGTPFTGTKELRVVARLPAERIGPLALTLRRSGDGHFTADTVELLPAGDWTLQIADRVSDFDEYTTTLEVPIR